MRITKDLVAASATPLVLGILAKEESYGYAILKRVGELSSGQLEWSDGLLYPLLHRLERLGYVESSWRAVDGGRRRKYYGITEQGRAELAEQRRQWAAVVDALRGTALATSLPVALAPLPGLASMPPPCPKLRHAFRRPVSHVGAGGALLIWTR